MTPEKSDLRKAATGYMEKTHRPLNCLVFIIPLMVLFHLGSALNETTLMASRDMRRILGVFGATAWFLPPALIALVLVMMHLSQRRKWRVHPTVLAGMLVESVLWAIPRRSRRYIRIRIRSSTTPRTIS